MYCVYKDINKTGNLKKIFLVLNEDLDDSLIKRTRLMKNFFLRVPSRHVYVNTATLQCMHMNILEDQYESIRSKSFKNHMYISNFFYLITQKHIQETQWLCDTISNFNWLVAKLFCQLVYSAEI